MTLRVLVVDDQAVIRVGLRGIVDATPGYQVVGEAATGDEAVRLSERTQPDVVLMDIRMPGMDGIEATRRITSTPATAGVRVLILTTFDLDEYVYGALHAGASGFLLKDTPPTDLLSAISVIAAGDALLAPSVTRRLIHEFTRNPPPTRQPGNGTLATLTERETQVLTLVAKGLSNPEIARHLRISPATAKGHVRHLLIKLDARDRVHLVILAYSTGLAGPDPGDHPPRR
jgi:DNA-binding NarL/FixJ family response regulator